MSVAKLGGGASEPPTTVLGEDFPIICESCLGPNPYARMIRSEMAQECRISGSPFTAFRWQGALRRWKSTIVCAAVAREKNCCQACLADLEYGVPFHVRDHVMDALGADAVPRSDVNKQYHWANKKQKVIDAQAGVGSLDTYEKLHGHVDKLRELAALDPGPVVWQQRRETPLTAEEQERLRQQRLSERRPPADASITSLFIGGVPPSVDRKELLPYFLAYGEVREVSVDAQRLAAIVTYRERVAAEAACKALYGNLTIRGSRCRVMWARKKGRSAEPTASAVHDHYGDGAPAAPLPPPPPGGACRGAATQSSKRAMPLPPPGVKPPPGVRPPPGIKSTVPAASPNYPSQNPDAAGARPEL